MKCKMAADQVLKRLARQIRKEDAFYQDDPLSRQLALCADKSLIYPSAKVRLGTLRDVISVSGSAQIPIPDTATTAQAWLNSNKGTKSDMEVCPSPYSPRLCLRGIPQLSAPFKQPILGA